MILFIIFATLFFARYMSGYDSRYNDRKHFVLKNKKIAKILLPKSAGWQRSTKRTKTDFNKMTYAGAVFYFCNLLLVLSIPVFLFLIPDIKIQPFEIDSRYIYLFADSLNTKLPVLLSLIMLAVEIVFEFLNIISQSKKQNNKGMIILSSITLILIIIFGLLQVKELISTFIEVLS